MLIRRVSVIIFLFSFHLATGSTLTKPPQSALIIAFEKPYEQSLLAYTLSDQNIDATLIIASTINDRQLYENLQGIEVLKLNTTSKDDISADEAALNACETLLSDGNIIERVREIQPTFVIFPAIRHDACLLPWTEHIKSIPVITSHGYEEDLYAVQRTSIALPIYTGGFWSGFWSNVDSRALVASVNGGYVVPALKLIKKHIQRTDVDLEKLYSRVEFVLSSGDSILRSDFALLNRRLIDIGCHHCRGAHPLPASLQKELVEFRLGTIVSTLDKSFANFVKNIARKLPQGRQGLAVAWKNRDFEFVDGEKPENLFVNSEVDRQDLLGYARARVLLSHCDETELHEAIFHGTPIICFPRDNQERKNVRRTIDLGFGVTTRDDKNIDAIVESIEIVHKTTSYREKARAFSSLMRDRPLPASDRLVYWLDYAARNVDRTIKLPVLRANEVRTFAEDSQVFSAFLIGTIIGIVLTIGAILAWYKTKNNAEKQHGRKDKRFDR